MKKISAQLQDIVLVSSDKMKKMSSGDWEFRKTPEKWSKKESLGHLIDSAANNHQRFVRAQYGNKTPISYDGDAWVKTQDYNTEPALVLVELWKYYNIHLAHVISKIPSDKYNALFYADAKEPVTLDWIVNDYIKHLEYHLKQILSWSEKKSEKQLAFWIQL